MRAFYFQSVKSRHCEALRDEAIQTASLKLPGLLRREAPRNDGLQIGLKFIDDITKQFCGFFSVIQSRMRIIKIK